MSSAMPNDVDGPVLLREDADAIATVTLNRPKQFNALSGDMLAALQSALDDIEQDERIRVVIIAARGRAFCAGHDLKEMRSNESQDFHRQLFARCSRMMVTINQMSKPVIAQVNGIATAAGCQLVAACDLAVAADDARFAVSGINLGLFCSTPAVALSRNVALKRAMHMLLTGDFIDAQTALEYGLVNDVVPAAELARGATELAEKIIAKSALAVVTGKKMFYRQLNMGLEEAYRFAGDTMACNMDSDDAREGVDAFIEKRKPKWRGC